MPREHRSSPRFVTSELPATIGKLSASSEPNHAFLARQAQRRLAGLSLLHYLVDSIFMNLRHWHLLVLSLPEFAI